MNVYSRTSNLERSSQNGNVKNLVRNEAKHVVHARSVKNSVRLLWGGSNVSEKLCDKTNFDVSADKPLKNLETEKIEGFLICIF